MSYYCGVITKKQVRDAETDETSAKDGSVDLSTWTPTKAGREREIGEILKEFYDNPLGAMAGSTKPTTELKKTINRRECKEISRPTSKVCIFVQSCTKEVRKHEPLQSKRTLGVSLLKKCFWI